MDLISAELNPGPPAPVDDGRQLALFWCETSDHDEDWFVVAPSEEEAADFFEDAEGYNPGDATATLVAAVPPALAAAAIVGWPDDELLIACGGDFVPYRPSGNAEDDAERALLGVVTKALRFGDRVFVAGDVVANNKDPRGRGRPS